MKKKISIEFIKYIDLIKIDKGTRNLRIQKWFFTYFKKYITNTNNIDNKLIKEDLKALNNSISDHSDILIIRTDKGNIVIILDLNDYNEKMQKKILSDPDTYMTIKKVQKY